jgi:hypothetical protein
MRKLLSFHLVLGDGKSLFRTAAERISLALLQARSFRSGNVLPRYRPTARQASFGTRSGGAV